MNLHGSHKMRIMDLDTGHTIHLYQTSPFRINGWNIRQYRKESLDKPKHSICIGRRKAETITIYRTRSDVPAFYAILRSNIQRCAAAIKRS